MEQHKRPAHWRGCLTEEQFDRLELPHRIGIMRIGQDGFTETDWQWLIGRTRRRHAKLESFCDSFRSTDAYKGRMVPYEELGLIPNEAGEHPAVACIRYTVDLLCCQGKEFAATDTDLFARLQAAEPGIFFTASTTHPSIRRHYAMPMPPTASALPRSWPKAWRESSA